MRNLRHRKNTTSFKLLSKAESDYAFLIENYESYYNSIQTMNIPEELLEDMSSYDAFYMSKYDDPEYKFVPKTYVYEQRLLYEGLLFSTEPNFAALKIKLLLTKFLDTISLTHKMQLLINYNITSGEIYVLWPDKNIIDIKLSLETLLNNLGYFIAKTYIKFHKFLKTKYTEIIIEPKFNYEMTNYVYKENNGILYHLAPLRYKERILKFGLIPKNKSKQSYHPERIYCLLSNENIQLLSDELLQTDNYPSYLKNCNIDNKMCLFKIDLNNHPHKLEFFKDSAYSENGVYTLENISPWCIEYIKDI